MKEMVLMDTKSSFVVLKRRNDTGPIYKVEICPKSLKVISKEILSSIPEGWMPLDFYDLLEEGKRLDISLDT